MEMAAVAVDSSCDVKSLLLHVPDTSSLPTSSFSSKFFLPQTSGSKPWSIFSTYPDSRYFPSCQAPSPTSPDLQDPRWKVARRLATQVAFAANPTRPQAFSSLMPIEIVSNDANVVTLEVTGYGLRQEQITVIPQQPGPLVRMLITHAGPC